jgi:hypothetical protein
VTFVDETSDIASNYDGDSPETAIPRFEDRITDQSVLSDTTSQGESQSQGRNPSLGTRSLALSTSSSLAKSSTELVIFSQPLDSHSLNQPIPSYHHPLTIEELTDQRATRSTPQHGHQTHGNDHGSSTVPQIYSSTPTWPLTDPSEALLLRHFVQNLATWVRNTNPFSMSIHL